MTTPNPRLCTLHGEVVEAYRLDRYDNQSQEAEYSFFNVVEAYRLDRYDNIAP